MNRPTILYKYASMSSAIKILKNEAVLLNSPVNFNDPFDSQIKITEEEENKVIELTINYFTFKIFCDFVERKDIKLKPSQKLLFKTIQLEVATYKKMIKKVKSYNYLPYFNEMAQYFSEINDDLKEAIAAAKDKFNKEIKPSLEAMRNKARISCFSTKNDSILMWSHYADSHKGVCFEFEETRPFFKKINYSSQKTLLNLYDAVSRALAFDFLGEKLTYQDKVFFDIMLKPLYTKSLEWTYENEVRCLLSDTEFNNPDIFYDDDKMLLKMKIKKIYIGAKAEGANLEELIFYANNRKIPVVFMKEDEENYFIVPDPEKKAPGKIQGIPSRNVIEILDNEIENCLRNEAYVSAVFCALSIPGIMGNVNYPELSYKDAYIRWYQDCLGQYDDSGTKNMPYITGDVCYNLKESMHNLCSNTGVIGDYGKFRIDGSVLKIEDKNHFDMYSNEAALVRNSSGIEKAIFEISIRDLCFKVLLLAKKDIEKNPDLITKLPKLNLRYFNKEIDAMNERNIMARNYYLK